MRNKDTEVNNKILKRQNSARLRILRYDEYKRKGSFGNDNDGNNENDLAKDLEDNYGELEKQKSTEINSGSDADKTDSEEEEDFRDDEI